MSSGPSTSTRGALIGAHTRSWVHVELGSAAAVPAKAAVPATAMVSAMTVRVRRDTVVLSMWNDVPVSKRRSVPRRLKSKHARAICKAVLATKDGSVELSARGHLLVHGPKGCATVGSSGSSYHATANAVASIRKYSGLDITVRV